MKKQANLNNGNVSDDVAKNDSIKSLIEGMKELNARVAQFTPIDKNGKAVFVLFMIDHPDEVELADLKKLQAKWDREGQKLEMNMKKK